MKLGPIDLKPGPIDLKPGPIDLKPGLIDFNVCLEEMESREEMEIKRIRRWKAYEV